MKVWLFGLPTLVGGALVESGDTALLWRRLGWDVHLLHLKRCKCGEEQIKPEDSPGWCDVLREAGVTLHESSVGELSGISGLPGSVVVNFCNSHGLHAWPELHALECKLVAVPCMTFHRHHESLAFAKLPPDAVVFQSQYQRGLLEGQYRAWGCDRVYSIHGAFEPLEFKPRQRVEGEPFVVGRLARANRSKWHPDFWRIIGDAHKAAGPLHALAMGWSEELTQHCGEPPENSIVMRSGLIPTPDFLNLCHALICPNFSVTENWPRVGLEAMSAGVPLIVDDAGGWREMCGDATMYCKTPHEFSRAIELLSSVEEFRQLLIATGRTRVTEISDPDEIGSQWRTLLESLGQDKALAA